MDRERAIRELKKLQDNFDIEAAHWEADKILVNLLHSIGYEDVAIEWGKIKKWYA